VSDQRFEDRLLDQLRPLVAAPPRPPARRAHRRLALAAGAGIAVAIAAGVSVPLLSGGAQPAYAVTPNDDGTVTVQINSLRDASGLEQKLREAGVPAVVEYLPFGKGCRQPWFTPAGPSTGGGAVRSAVGGSSGGPTTFTVTRPPAGQTLVITTHTGPGAPDGHEAVGIGIGHALGTVPPCRVVDDPSSVPPGPGSGRSSGSGG